MTLEPSEGLIEARRRLDGETWIRIHSEWKHHRDDQFFFRLSVEIDGESDYVPRHSEWYVLASAAYPYGRVELLPAKEGGLQRTFPHQRLNVSPSPSSLWLNGNPCLTDWNRQVLRGDSEFEMGLDRLPYLVWLLQRWLENAAKGTLKRPGDPYEIPEFNSYVGDILAYFEDEASFSFWENLNIAEGIGLCDICRTSKVLVIRSFRNARNQILKDAEGKEGEHPLLLNDQGASLLSEYIAPPKISFQGPAKLRPFAHFITRPNPSEKAVWILMPEVPVSDPWHPPTNWAELRSFLDSEDWQELHRLLRTKAPGYLLVGMPIPKILGGPVCQIHWQGIKVPALSGAKDLKTLRPTKANILYADREGPLGKDSKLEWLTSENWSASQLSRRFNEPEANTYEDVLIIGCGAFGSTLAELLARAGTRKIWLCDFDLLKGGNLVRGAYQIRDVGKAKAQVLADRLSAISPHVRPVPLTGGFARQRLNLPMHSFKYVFDCSAENSVLQEMELAGFHPEARIVSLSATWKAKRLLAVHSRAASFNARTARAFLAPMHGDTIIEEEIRPEGVGCYHPAFPADPHRVSLCVSLALERMRVWANQDGLISEFYDLEDNAWNG